jgi:hypothetical protein
MARFGIFGISIGIVYLAIGIASLVISVRNVSDCGTDAVLTVRQWLFGTGIAYTTIGASMGIGGLLLILTVVGIIPLLIILIFAPGFTVAWSVVGAVSLWRDGLDCETLNPEIWNMGMAAAIVSLIMCIPILFGYRYAKDDDE